MGVGKIAHSKKTKNKISEVRKRIFKEGKIVIWNKGLKLGSYEERFGIEKAKEIKDKLSKLSKGRLPPQKNKSFNEYYGEEKAKKLKERISLSNKGKKRTNNVKEKFSKLRKEEYATGKRKPWNKGLTKENNESLKRVSKKNTGQKRTKNFCDLRSKTTKGKNNSFYGKQHTKETKEKLSKYWKKYWKEHPAENNEREKKALITLSKRPTKVEQKFIDLCKKHNLPYKYVGDGKHCIAGLFPDFVNTQNKNEIIEIFGTAFHNPELSFREHIPYKQTEKGRIEHFTNYGFDCKVIWDYELSGDNWEKDVLHKLNY